MKFNRTHSHIPKETTDTYGRLSAEYISRIKNTSMTGNYDAPECSVRLPYDEAYLQETKAMIQKKKTAKLKYIVVVGIGGSNLGTKAIYEALRLYQDERQMFFLDTIDPEQINQFLRFMRKNVRTGEEILVNIISKSGGTTESLINAELLIQQLRSVSLDWKKQCVITTDENSRLWKEADANGIDILRIPKNVGGRYSVLSAVGMFPLGLCGVTIDEIMSGARDAITRGVNTDIEKNDSFQSAVYLYEHARRGRNIADTFVFHTELESLGKWYRQLMGESIGKDGEGITPTVTVGSIDHHSIVQLYLGGPKDKTTTFIYSSSSDECSVPQKTVFMLSEEFHGMELGVVMKAIRKGTEEAYKKQGLSFVGINLEKLCERELGWFVQMKMVEMMYLGSLMKINAFDQPHVEIYKQETKKQLKGKQV